jgi:hypothetical protein
MSGARAALCWVNLLKGIIIRFEPVFGHPRGIANSGFVTDRLSY